MAGVGRRGYFAAAARAAMFTATAGHAAGVASQNADADGMDGRRANALKYLDTGVTNFSHCEFHFASVSATIVILHRQLLHLRFPQIQVILLIHLDQSHLFPPVNSIIHPQLALLPPLPDLQALHHHGHHLQAIIPLIGFHSLRNSKANIRRLTRPFLLGKFLKQIHFPQNRSLAMVWHTLSQVMKTMLVNYLRDYPSQFQKSLSHNPSVIKYASQPWMRNSQGRILTRGPLHLVHRRLSDMARLRAAPQSLEAVPLLLLLHPIILPSPQKGSNEQWRLSSKKAYLLPLGLV